MHDLEVRRRRDISAKAGDILVTRARSLSSRVIRAATFSRWSHVGIAIDSEWVLEAVKDGGVARGPARQVRVVTIEAFAAQASAVRHYVRPAPLSARQTELLKQFADSNSTKGYTVLHALLTLATPVMQIVFGLFAVVSTLHTLATARPSEWAAWPVWLAVICINGVIYVCYRAMAWSLRSQWGVDATERLFRRSWIGRLLVDIKYEMFCSKLVLLAEEHISGDLARRVPREADVQPGHIASACDSLDWGHVDA